MRFQRYTVLTAGFLLSFSYLASATSREPQQQVKSKVEVSKVEGRFSDGSTVELNMGAGAVIQVKDRTSGAVCYALASEGANFACVKK